MGDGRSDPPAAPGWDGEPTFFRDQPATLYRVSKIINFWSWEITERSIFDRRIYSCSIEFQVYENARKRWDGMEWGKRVWETTVIFQAPKTRPRQPWQIILGRPYCDQTGGTCKTSRRAKSGSWSSTSLRFQCAEVIQSFKS